VDLQLAGAVTAAWLGILTSISPCPIATNVVAISFVSRDVRSPARVLATGMLYTLGRTLTYVSLGVLLVSSMLSISHVSLALQYWMNRLLGPILILVGMFLFDFFQIRFSTSFVHGNLQERASSWGPWGAGLLGVIFALSFCPVSAALFFGSLIPLSVSSGSNLMLPALYGLGTGLPVSVFAVAIALGAKSISRALDGLGRVERWARRITGVVFIIAGVYYACDHIFELF
jgi:cytochrome c-type biogenesis protein